MIVAYILVAIVGYGSMNPMPPFSDMASCERAKAALNANSNNKACVQVIIPAPSREAFNAQPSKIGDPK